MTTMSGIDGSPKALPAVRADVAGPRPRPNEVFQPAAGLPHPPLIDDRTVRGEPTEEQFRAAVSDLQALLDDMPGPGRDVDLRFEDDGDFIVEIRRRDDGVVIQRFPPENLLNLNPSAADLLGTVVDRRS